MQLSKHFTLAELTRSHTALRHGISNKPPIPVIDQLATLAVNILEPLREHLGRPIRVTSGYRAPALNSLLGGSPTSAHMTGDAADIVCITRGQVDFEAMHEAAHFLETQTAFDQLIWEHDGAWIHIGQAPDGAKCRYQVLKTVSGRQAAYTRTTFI